jgi:DNA-binding response OmpR family regulator
VPADRLVPSDVSREELRAGVGYDYFGDTRLVNVHVGWPRANSKSFPGEPQVVATVPSRGDRLTT